MFVSVYFYVSDVNKIQEGVGDKMGAALQWVSTCVAGLIIAFVRSWKLTLVCLSFSPLIAISGGITMKVSINRPTVCSSCLSLRTLLTTCYSYTD
jgi:ABC-type bacteriocin/lantibiotic exporter with double-glycine peptidase domain